MIKALPVKKIRYLEESAKKIGLSERILIENASSNLSAIIDSLNIGKKICVVSGWGNNGADALACARKLSAKNYKVHVIILNEKDFNAEVKFQKEILEKIKIPVYLIGPENIKEFKKLIKASDFILDGILGIGAHGGLSNFLKKIIRDINESAKKIVSCDVPSGLSADSGNKLGEAVRADYTITFIAPKPGFFKNCGKTLCGKIYVADIGISKDILKKFKA
ncbi:MAG: NAD(P)H-hydrate epimerase [Candidatus Omnitrophica bacterium]|nr:NAD(P)H-hydrate epimerase [Candidatus Omnitrophota bacterium]